MTEQALREFIATVRRSQSAQPLVMPEDTLDRLARLDKQAQTMGRLDLVALIELVRRREVDLRALEERARRGRSAAQIRYFPHFWRTGSVSICNP